MTDFELLLKESELLQGFLPLTGDFEQIRLDERMVLIATIGLVGIVVEPKISRPDFIRRNSGKRLIRASWFRGCGVETPF